MPVVNPPQSHHVVLPHLLPSKPRSTLTPQLLPSKPQSTPTPHPPSHHPPHHRRPLPPSRLHPRHPPIPTIHHHPHPIHGRIVRVDASRGVGGRQMEMLNVLIGYEQANKYAVKTFLGENVGFIAEEDVTVMGGVLRQVMRTRRAIRR
ncbi:hypothetical protein BC829DRAFT_291734 [Chytridium lagenaria]|nr:hypothetical protein BC829DRAFT_291734 [Chytridium lagenaria]